MFICSQWWPVFVGWQLFVCTSQRVRRLVLNGSAIIGSEKEQQREIATFAEPKATLKTVLVDQAKPSILEAFFQIAVAMADNLIHPEFLQMKSGNIWLVCRNRWDKIHNSYGRVHSSKLTSFLFSSARSQIC